MWDVSGPRSVDRLCVQLVRPCSHVGEATVAGSMQKTLNSTDLKKGEGHNNVKLWD
jgi:hypothetical protein